MRLLKNRKGQGMLEYVLIAAAVVGLAVILIKAIKGPANAQITAISSGLNTSVSGN